MTRVQSLRALVSLTLASLATLVAAGVALAGGGAGPHPG
jgi:hypothetical protein